MEITDSDTTNPLVMTDQGYISSLSDLMNILKNIQTRGTKALYRGQSIDKPLLPRFARIAEQSLITNPLQVERRIFEAFMRQSIPFISQPYPSSDWDRLALAQHYGLPTRLLDWTGNPLDGLWFAVENDPHKGKNGVFWVLIPDLTDIKHPDTSSSPFTLKRTYIFQPSHITRRISAQDGWFTVHKYLDEPGKFIHLENNKNYINMRNPVHVDHSIRFMSTTLSG